MVKHIIKEIPHPLNLFDFRPVSPEKELMDSLLQAPHFYVERIVSHGHASPEGFWYDQDHAEWVLLVEGRAVLEFADDRGKITLNKGDYLHIPAHARHRLHWTDPDCHTVWLAIHY